VAAAFVAAERLLDCGTTWALLDTATMAEDARLAMFDRTARALRGHIADVLRAGRGTEVAGDLIADLAQGVGLLSHTAADLLRGEAQAEGRRLSAELAAAGIPGEVAARVVHLYDMDGAIGLAHLAAERQIDATALTGAFANLGEALGLDWAQQVASRASPSDPWERLLVAGLARDFQQMRLEFLGRADNADPSAHVAAWLGAHARLVAQYRALIGRAQATGTVAPAMLAQLAGQARTLLMR
jgi:glutamate dehydrogenase